MSKETLNQVKKERGFKLYDLIIYAVIVALIVLAFVLSGTLLKGESIDGIEIRHKNAVVFTYLFNGDKYEIKDGEKVEIVSNDEDTLTIKFYPENLKYKYNQIEIDKVKKTVKVVEATCSTRKDCVHTQELKSNSQSIICIPHELIILPLGQSVSDKDIIL